MLLRQKETAEFALKLLMAKNHIIIKLLKHAATLGNVFCRFLLAVYPPKDIISLLVPAVHDVHDTVLDKLWNTSQAFLRLPENILCKIPDNGKKPFLFLVEFPGNPSPVVIFRSGNNPQGILSHQNLQACLAVLCIGQPVIEPEPFHCIGLDEGRGAACLHHNIFRLQINDPGACPVLMVQGMRSLLRPHEIQGNGYHINLVAMFLKESGHFGQGVG